MTTQEFIDKNREADTRQLALQAKRYADIDFTFALNQIAGWQTARKKLPAWADTKGIIYPPHISMEQCSSEPTALYKTSLLNSLPEVEQFVDLTGGFGVDFSYMSKAADKAVYVEQQQHLCDIAIHNLDVLGLSHKTEVVCGDGTDYLRRMQPVDVIYLDPARRDDKGSRTYAIEDCTPNVVELQHLLLEKAKRVIIKLSPMLDWHKAVADVANVSEIHIISVQNECKELLLVLDQKPSPLRLFCINDNQKFVVSQSEKTEKLIHYRNPVVGDVLCVPNASIMKAGSFCSLCQEYNLSQIAPNSNLFVADSYKESFPGRQSRIERLSTMNKKELKTFLSGVDSANIATRNFPLTPVELRKRLKLKDGGSNYIFATTDSSNNHILILSHPI